jgi:hypothetical protein
MLFEIVILLVKARRRGLHFWDFSIGSIAPGKLNKEQLKYLE